MKGKSICSVLAVGSTLAAGATPPLFSFGHELDRYAKPMDFVVADGALHVLEGAVPAGGLTIHYATVGGGGMSLLVTAMEGGDVVAQRDLSSALDIRGPRMQPVTGKIVEYAHGLTILAGGADFVVARANYDGRIEKARDVRELMPEAASWSPIGLERYLNYVLLTFNHGLLALDEKHDVVAAWMPNGVVVAAAVDGNLLWAVEVGQDDRREGFVGDLVALGFDGEFVERSRVRIPGETSLFPKILPMGPDETVVLLADDPVVRRCSYYPKGAAAISTMECDPLDLGDAPRSVTLGAPWLRALRVDDDSYALGFAAFCGAWSRIFDRRHKPTGRELSFFGERGRPAPAGGAHEEVLDLLLRSYDGRLYGVIGVRRRREAQASEFSNYLVRPVQSRVATAGLAAWRKSCPQWNNETFFFDATGERVAACLDAGAPPNGGGRCDGVLRPLTQAAAISEVDVVAKLLAAGSDPAATDGLGRSALHDASASREPSADRALGIVKLLLGAGADANARSAEGLSPLHYAAKNNRDPAIVIGLLDAGADPAVQDDAGRTPWEYARENDALRDTEALLRLAPAP